MNSSPRKVVHGKHTPLVFSCNLIRRFWEILDDLAVAGKFCTACTIFPAYRHFNSLDKPCHSSFKNKFVEPCSLVRFLWISPGSLFNITATRNEPKESSVWSGDSEPLMLDEEWSYSETFESQNGLMVTKWLSYLVHTRTFVTLQQIAITNRDQVLYLLFISI